MPANFSRRSQRKTQARLAFDPVEPSSSATMSTARIRYQVSSSPTKAFDLTSPSIKADDAESDSFPSGKKYAVVIETPKKQKQDGRLPFKPLGMADSSQAQRIIMNSAESSNEDPSDSDLEILPSFRRQRAHRSSLPTESSSLSHPSIGAHRFMSGKKKRRPMAYDGAGDDSSAGSSPEEQQPTDNKTRTKGLKRKPVTLRSITLSDDDSGFESPLESPDRVLVKHGQAILPKIKSQENADEPQSVDMRMLISGGSVNFSQKLKKTPQKSDIKKTRSTSRFSSRKGARGTQDSSTRSEGEDAIAILPIPQRTRGHGTRKKQIIITDDSEDLDVEIKTPQTRSSRALNALDGDLNEDGLPSPSLIKDFSGPNAIGARTFGDDEAQRDDTVVRSSGKRRLRKRVEKDSEEQDTDEDDEDPISSPLKRRRMTVEDESESDPFISPRNRLRPRFIEQKEAERNQGRQTNRVTRQQQQKKPHRTEREKKLELLKRQRAGEKIIELTSSESDAVGPRHGIYDSDSDLQVLSEFEDEEEGEDEGIEEVRRSLLPSYRDDNEDDFIIDDDDVPLGVLGHGLNEIPLEFTHHAHKPLKEHFKDAVEWMIQNKINPAFGRKDPIYIQAFRKLDLEVQGYATSIYSSAVWKEAFTRALWARPVFLESTIGPGDEHEGNKCDACGRSNHPASFEIQFTGNAYNKDTLDEIDNDHSDGEDNDTDSINASVNSNGQTIPGTDVSWFVGRFCKANAQTAHSLIHWKHALNEWVIDRLKTDGHLAPQKLAEREDWSTNKRSKYANSIVDEWEEEGEIKALYRDFKINLDVARQGKQTRWSK